MIPTRSQFEARLLARGKQIATVNQDAYLAAGRGDRSIFGFETWVDGEMHRIGHVVDRWAGRVPPLWRAADLDRLDASQQPEQIRAFLPSPARTLLLAGPVGTGKSFAAWAVAHEASAHGIRARAWSLPRLLVDMRPDGDSEAFSEACNVDFLLLDDLGAAKPSDWAIEQIYAIAEERVNFQRRTVVTTNSDFEELERLWGAPTMDRLIDMSVSIDMIGESRRGPS